MLIKRFEDIEAWKEARKLVSMVYNLTDRPLFKKDFGLKDQIQRAGVSCVSNIAEGFDSDTKQQFIQMLSYTKRSSSEVQSELYVALDRKYITKQEFEESYQQAKLVRKLTNGFIRYLRVSQLAGKPVGRLTSKPVSQLASERVNKPANPTTRTPANPTTRILLIIAVFCLLFASTASANNIQVTNAELKDLASVAPANIEFDISWENSWRYGDLFYDAAWVFAKYSVNDGVWHHATILNYTSVGSGTGLAITVPSDSKGAFLYRSSADTGALSTTNIQLQWDHQTDGVAYNVDKIEIRVFAIEMVYIAQGPFYVGDTDNDTTNCFFRADGTYTKDEALGPYHITSEAEIIVGTADGNLCYDEDNVYDGDRAGPIPAVFPKGYNAFYIMKYGISQGQYCDFLNTLTQAEQNTRTATGLTAENIAGYYVMSNTTTVSYRQAIKAGTDPADGQPYWFGCDLDADGILNEANDGQWIACNYLSWIDGAAYADWAALRPFTELEFEKACRGPSAVVDGEYAWGNTTITGLETGTGNTLQNGGQANAVVSSGNCHYNNSGSWNTGGGPYGPVRCGIFAGSSTNRQGAGASFYGVMELSGNLWKRPVTVGNATGRGFTGTHGNGALSGGNADNADWPGTNAIGSGFRGGHWRYGSSFARVSDRLSAATANASRHYAYGGRCARTSP